jgi:hypothetical protein
METELDEINDEKWLEPIDEYDSIEHQQPQPKKYKINVQSAIDRFQNDGFVVPLILVTKLFEFEIDIDGNLRLKQTFKDYWKAINLYILLKFRENKLGTNKILVSARFLKKGLCCRYETIERAIEILKAEKLIKNRKTGRKLHAVKHYITLIKIT